MNSSPTHYAEGRGRDGRVAVLADCDNISPDILAHALRVAAQFGSVVIRRGYGNHTTLAHKWQQALLQWAFTPCLQYQYAAGKNTSDLALALDAMEILFDDRATMFCLVTSDSDFAYLCRKLRERGATVCVVGEAKTPDALRNASDQFVEWSRPEVPAEDTTTELAGRSVVAEQKAAAQPAASLPRNDTASSASVSKPGGATSAASVKRRPLFVVDAVTLLVADTAESRVGLGALGQYLKRADPAFSPKVHGHSGLLDMVKTYDKLVVRQEDGGYWVSLAGQSAVGAESS